MDTAATAVMEEDMVEWAVWVVWVVWVVWAVWGTA